MRPLALILEEWLGETDAQTREVVVWSRLFGDDVERAWRECPRGDYLLSIAGACGCEPSGIAQLVLELAAETLPETASFRRSAQSALRVAEARDIARMGERIRATARAIDRASDRQEAENASVAGVLARALGAIVRQAPRLEDLGTRAARVQQLPAVRALAKPWQREHTYGADAASLRIALAALVVSTAEARLAALDMTRVKEDDDADERREASTELFREAAIALRQCAAVADYRARRDGGMFERMLGAMSGVVLSGDAGPERLGDALSTSLAPSIAAGTAKLAELADRVRALVPFDALGLPRREESPGSRAAFRRAMDRMAGPAREMKEPSLDGALALTRAILDAPGPLDQSRFLRSLGALYAAFADALERASRGRAPAHEKVARARAEEARRMAREAVAMAGVGSSLAN